VDCKEQDEQIAGNQNPESVLKTYIRPDICPNFWENCSATDTDDHQCRARFQMFSEAVYGQGPDGRPNGGIGKTEQSNKSNGGIASGKNGTNRKNNAQNGADFQSIFLFDIFWDQHNTQEIAYEHSDHGIGGKVLGHAQL